MTRAELANLIEKAGKIPVERDSYYNPISTCRSSSSID
jgi:2-iminoacetate synthase ThiH